MDDLDVLARDFGLRPQGKSNPMRSEGGGLPDRRSASGRSSSSSPFFDDQNNNSNDQDGLLFDDVFGGPPKFTASSNKSSAATNDLGYDSLFNSSAAATNDSARSNRNNSSKTSSFPVYDKPVYDDDIFDGLPGIKSKSVASGMFDDGAFVAVASPPQQMSRNSSHDQVDDLLGKLGRNERNINNNNKSSGAAGGIDDFLGRLGVNERVSEGKGTTSKSSSSRGFDDLLGGFGSVSSASGNRPSSDLSHGSKSASGFSQSTSSVMDDPFVVFGSTTRPGSSTQGVFTDPLEEIDKLQKSGSMKSDVPSASGGAFDDLDPLNGFGKSSRPISPENSNRGKDGSPPRSGSNANTQASPSKEQIERSSYQYSESHSQRKAPEDKFQESPLFDMPTTDSQADMMSPRSEERVQPSDDIWLTVSEVPLFTQPTHAPPPSRPPPAIPRRNAKSEAGFFSSSVRMKSDEFASPSSYSSYSQSPRPVNSQIDELENFAMGRTHDAFEESNIQSSEDMNASSVAAASAAAMKEAMDRAEAKFRHAKEVREREYAKAARTKEAGHAERDEQAMQESQEREYRENKERLEHQQRQQEEEEREQRRLEREKERAREIEASGRQAVERATREARERAAVGARDRAAAEARLKSERAAVQRAQAEARERAAAEARDRVEKAAADARERANAEAREKDAREKAAVDRAAAEARRRAERAAVDRAAAEARERAAAEARERASATARSNQQKNDNDLESFFSMGSRPSSAPRPRASSSSDTTFDTQFQSTGGPQGTKTTSGGSSSNMRKASSTTNIVDDLSSIFGAAPSGEFQDIEGETEERRRARLERHQRTQERAAKAVAEKNQRDLHAQQEQEERHRIAGTLDIEIKRWAAGKEGNLRALLSTLQYVLWPECGWQPVSLTDLITGASVKKVYRKATLCIHPDKVQQKGATLQQKYIAEKVFDLLKEAWNKLNSEELF